MAKLIVKCQGNRGVVSRLGHSEGWAKIQSWNSGIHVQAILQKNGKYRYDVYKTGGSSGYIQDKVYSYEGDA